MLKVSRLSSGVEGLGLFGCGLGLPGNFSILKINHSTFEVGSVTYVQ
jgi:hypothetical protein